MAQKIYAQEDIRLDEKNTIKRGDVFCELPDGISLDHVVSFATTGKLGGEVKTPEPTPAVAPAVAPAPVEVAAPAKPKSGVIGGAAAPTVETKA